MLFKYYSTPNATILTSNCKCFLQLKVFNNLLSEQQILKFKLIFPIFYKGEIFYKILFTRIVTKCSFFLKNNFIYRSCLQTFRLRLKVLNKNSYTTLNISNIWDNKQSFCLSLIVFNTNNWIGQESLNLIIWNIFLFIVILSYVILVVLICLTGVYLTFSSAYSFSKDKEHSVKNFEDFYKNLILNFKNSFKNWYATVNRVYFFNLNVIPTICLYIILSIFVSFYLVKIYYLNSNHWLLFVIFLFKLFMFYLIVKLSILKLTYYKKKNVISISSYLRNKWKFIFSHFSKYVKLSYYSTIKQNLPSKNFWIITIISFWAVNNMILLYLYTKWLSHLSTLIYSIKVNSIIFKLFSNLGLNFFISMDNSSLIFNLNYIYYYFFTLNISLLVVGLLAYYNVNILNLFYYYWSLISIVVLGFITQTEFLLFFLFIYSWNIYYVFYSKTLVFDGLIFNNPLFIFFCICTILLYGLFLSSLFIAFRYKFFLKLFEKEFVDISINNVKKFTKIWLTGAGLGAGLGAGKQGLDEIHFRRTLKQYTTFIEEAEKQENFAKASKMMDYRQDYMMNKKPTFQQIFGLDVNIEKKANIDVSTSSHRENLSPIKQKEFDYIKSQEAWNNNKHNK